LIAASTQALVLIGAPGSGKSSVLEVLITLLDRDGVEYGAIESEQLSLGYPLLSGRQWTDQLDAVLALQREAGRRRFLIAATVENAEELCWVVAATRAESPLVACLHASADVLAERVAEREPDAWPGKAGLIAHARELALVIPNLANIDLLIDTEHRGAEQVAAQIYDEMRSRGLFQDGSAS
jgi:hypothetical protein